MTMIVYCIVCSPYFARRAQNHYFLGKVFDSILQCACLFFKYVHYMYVHYMFKEYQCHFYNLTNNNCHIYNLTNNN